MYVHVYMYMYTCTYVHRYICTYVYMYTCTYVYINIHMIGRWRFGIICIRKYMCMYICIHARALMFLRISGSVCVYQYTCATYARALTLENFWQRAGPATREEVRLSLLPV